MCRKLDELEMDLKLQNLQAIAFAVAVTAENLPHFQKCQDDLENGLYANMDLQSTGLQKSPEAGTSRKIKPNKSKHFFASYRRETSVGSQNSEQATKSRLNFL